MLVPMGSKGQILPNHSDFSDFDDTVLGCLCFNVFRMGQGCGVWIPGWGGAVECGFLDGTGLWSVDS